MADSQNISYLALFIGIVFAVSLSPPASANPDYDTDYDYGDPGYNYDIVDSQKGERAPLMREKGHLQPGEELLLPVTDKRNTLPLCCPKGEVYDHLNCVLPPLHFDWIPTLNGASATPFSYSGFPRCEMKRDYIQTFQTEVHFSKKDARVFLPYYIRLHPVDRDEYCIAKVYDPSDGGCEEFQTKIFTCYDGGRDPQGVLWVSVTLAHLFLFVTLVAFFLIADLRCLQGQYFICFVISLLIYNLCLFPISYFPLNITDISCIAIGAVKYFFFCGIFLWFNVICFDVWRTVKRKQDICGRRRFLVYSGYAWIIGAILTTVVLVLPYVKGPDAASTKDDPLKDADYDACKLKLPMNMILQIAQVFSLVLDLVFLVLATCCLYPYTKFGNGLARSEATLCLKQTWKMFVIMIAHTISGIDTDLLQFPVPFWLYILLESAAIFGVFTYRRTVMKKALGHRVCHSPCSPHLEPGSSQEKGQLTLQ